MAIDKQISEKRKRQCAKLVEISKDIVRKALDQFKFEELGITWTGGKDSGLGLWIIRQGLPGEEDCSAQDDDHRRRGRV